MRDVNKAVGSYKVKVRGVDVADKDGDGSNIQIMVGCVFDDGEAGIKYLGGTSEKAIAIMRKSLKAMGFDVDKRDLSELQENPSLLDGNEVIAVVEENVWNGRTTNQIAWINAIPKKAPPAALSRLTAALRNAKNDNAEDNL